MRDATRWPPAPTRTGRSRSPPTRTAARSDRCRTTTRYPARKGFDEFYGYGRLNAAAGRRGRRGRHDPAAGRDHRAGLVRPARSRRGARSRSEGSVGARVAYRCRGRGRAGRRSRTTARLPTGDFHAVPSTWCDGSAVRHSRVHRCAGDDRRRAPARDASRPGTRPASPATRTAAATQSSNGRPNTMPYAFTVRVVVSTASGTPMSGEDRRQMFLHRDADLLPALPGRPPRRRRLLAAARRHRRRQPQRARGRHLRRPDPRLPAGRPRAAGLAGPHSLAAAAPRRARRTAPAASAAYHYAAVLGALAAGDLFGDGRIEVVADDNQGDVMAWDGHGRLVFHAQSLARFSGAPLTPFHTVRQGVRDRTERGFLAAPVLASLDGHGTGRDRRRRGPPPVRLAADGRPVAGFPVLLADPDKVAAVDPVTGHITFRNVDAVARSQRGPGQDHRHPGGGQASDGRPVIFVGSNEEYGAEHRRRGSGRTSAPSNSLLTSLIGTRPACSSSPTAACTRSAPTATARATRSCPAGR